MVPTLPQGNPYWLKNSWEEGVFLTTKGIWEIHILIDHPLNEQSYKLLYTKAIHEILKMQSADIKFLEPYDDEFLMFEMKLMQEWYLDKFLWVTLDDDEQQILDDILELIKDVVLSQHRATLSTGVSTLEILCLRGVSFSL